MFQLGVVKGLEDQFHSTKLMDDLTQHTLQVLLDDEKPKAEQGQKQNYKRPVSSFMEDGDAGVAFSHLPFLKSLVDF